MHTYGTLTLLEFSPADSLVEPLTLAEVKTYLRIPEYSPATTDEDDLIETMIIAARETAEAYQHRDLIEKRYQLNFDQFPCDLIRLRAPLVSVERVRYRDSTGAWTTLTEGTDYIVDSTKHPGEVMPAYNTTWPSFTEWPSSSVEIIFSSGYARTDIFWGSSGQRILKGMQLLISAWYNGRLPFENRAGQPQELPFTVTALFTLGALPLV